MQPRTSFFPPGSVTNSHLVAYDLNKELLPLIHAHCCRTLEESSLTFNLDNLERAIEDHYVRGRPLITKRVEELIFREGALSNRVFQAIRKSVNPQEILSIALRKDILSELTSITALRDCLTVSETVIGFLSSTGGDPEMYIKDYLENVLSLPKEQQLQLNPKAHHCRLRHILSLWQVLSVERAKRRLASKKQDPFEGVGKYFREPLTKEEKVGVLKGLRHVNVEDFLAELFEFMVVQLKTIPMGTQDTREERPRLLMAEFNSFLANKGRGLHGFDRMADRNHKLAVSKAVDVWCIAAQKKSTR
ncbi:E3 ubiquitin-protein ligase rnf213-alpha-like [Amphiura filiformis]|uniref:E3 ubiquitin-protein ligase rnf213-alpha-like n=1 Tax=Amphiura filiformis TaxID=82378 RepID=UPI003B2227B8